MDIRIADYVHYVRCILLLVGAVLLLLLWLAVVASSRPTVADRVRHYMSAGDPHRAILLAVDGIHPFPWRWLVTPSEHELAARAAERNFGLLELAFAAEQMLDTAPPGLGGDLRELEGLLSRTGTIVRAAGSGETQEVGTEEEWFKLWMDIELVRRRLSHQLKWPPTA